MKKTFKFFALLLALVFLTCTITGCKGGDDAKEVTLTQEEVQKVEEVAEVLDIVAEIEMPDLSDCISSVPSLMSTSKTGYNGLDSEKYQSMRLDFSVTQNSSLEFVLSDALKEQMQEEDPTGEFLAMFQSKTEVACELKGYVLLTDTSCQFTYTSVKIETNIASMEIQMDMPFALYMDGEEVYLRYDDFKYVMASQMEGMEEPLTIDAGAMVKDYLGDLLGKWIDLDNNYVSPALASYFTEAFAQCGNTLTKELNTYSEYIEENLSEKFVNKGGKYVLGSTYFKGFVEELYANTSVEDDSMDDIIPQDGGFDYNTLSGEFEFDISDMDKPKISMSYNMDAEQTIADPTSESSDNSMTIKVASNSSCSYAFSGFNSTTLERPTDVSGWPGLGLGIK